MKDGCQNLLSSAWAGAGGLQETEKLMSLGRKEKEEEEKKFDSCTDTFCIQSIYVPCIPFTPF